MWPEKDIPEDYLKLAKRLVASPSVTKPEFLQLCRMAVNYVEADKTTRQSRADMFLYIANIWLNHKNIDNDDLLGEIGGQFGEWEIPGTLNFDFKVYVGQWERMKSWLVMAEEKYVNHPDEK